MDATGWYPFTGFIVLLGPVYRRTGLGLQVGQARHHSYRRGDRQGTVFEFCTNRSFLIDVSQQTFRCQWGGCSDQFPTHSELVHHAKKHAAYPIACPYESTCCLR